MRLSLTSLGSASLTRYSADGPAEKILRPGKPLALLIYLAAANRRTASREHLIDTLWADVEPERGLRTLRQTIWQIRQLVGDDALVGDGREITLAAPMSFDRDDFLSAIADARYTDALDIYKGPFIPDFGVPGGADFEQWADRERDRLHLAYVRAAEIVIRDWLDHAQYDKAIAEARRLRDSERDRESNWRLLLEALSSSGDRLSALSEAEELQNFLTEANRSPERLTISAITRAQKTVSPAKTSALTERLFADLTGRDREFSRLTSAWTAVKTGRFQHLHVSAPPGLGKTRLLQDVFTRLRAGGARAVYVSALAVDRRLTYALASDLVAKIGVLSGASGVSTAAASSLVALNPTLSSNFAADVDRSTEEEALRHRVHAVAELIEAIAEESPLALFIDDLHWGDAVSRQLLKSVFSRISTARLLLITSSRIQPDGDLHLLQTEIVALAPLSPAHVTELITGFGSLPDEPWVTPFLTEMQNQSSGSPLLVLENLHLALDRGSLQLRDQKWSCPDEKSLIAGISHGDVLEQRLKKLDGRLFELLLLLAIAEEPVNTDVMSAALHRKLTDIETDLSDLEQQAMAVSVGTAWKCSHDSIAESAVRLADAVTRKCVQCSLGRALAQSAGTNPHELLVALNHLVRSCQLNDAEPVFRQFVVVMRNSGDRRSNLQLASTALGESLHSETAKRLVGSLPLTQRLGLTNRARMAAASALIVVAIGIPFEFLPAKPAQLAVVTQPLSGTVSAITPDAVVEIQDKNGNRVRGARDTVTVDVAFGHTSLAGTRSVAAVDGRAVFSDLSLTKEPPLTSATGIILRFKARGLRPVTTKEFNNTEAALHLVSGTLNGQQITPSHRAVVVHPGDTISGTVQLRYSSYWASASVILGATPTWGNRETDFVDLAPMTTPVVDQPRRSVIKFRAPDTPGTYHIIFAFDAEGNVEDFMSGTNWRLPKPIWHDGNDIVDWSPAQMAHANSTGWVRTRIYRIDDRSKKIIFDPHSVPATVIDVVVK